MYSAGFNPLSRNRDTLQDLESQVAQMWDTGYNGEPIIMVSVVQTNTLDNAHHNIGAMNQPL